MNLYILLLNDIFYVILILLLHDPTSLWLKIFIVPEGTYKGNWPYIGGYLSNLYRHWAHPT